MAIRGLPHMKLSVLAAVTPTTRAIVSPGWFATAIASISSLPTPACHRLGDDGIDLLDMGPRGDLRHDAAVLLVQLGLRGHDGRQHLPAVGHDRRRRLIAARFDAENIDFFLLHYCDFSLGFRLCQ